MKSSKKLWMIIGPVITAFLILGVLLLLPLRFDHNSKLSEEKAAVSLSPQIFKGRQFKEQALSGKYVPFFGSSELKRMDPYHPSVLAAKYNRNYRPFLLGNAGTQCLTQYFAMQTILSQLKDKKAVFIISPQWFVAKGDDPNAFAYYYSKLQAVTWLQHENGSKMDKYAAGRLLQMPSGRSDKFIKNLLYKAKFGHKITGFDRFRLDVDANILNHEDQLFSAVGLNNNLNKIKRGEKRLPNSESYSVLDKHAYSYGKKRTNNNRFRINNNFYKRRLVGYVKGLKGEQKNFDYRKSPEYGDLELVLNQFAKTHTNVLFIIPPINSLWTKYTGLNSKMVQQTDNKIVHQLKSQGFNHVVDLNKYGSEPYFMEDTIHIGYRGWVKVDEYVRPFMKEKNKKVNYDIKNKFYSYKWQQLFPSKKNLTNFN